MNTGNTEQTEAAIVESMIQAKCKAVNGTETNRTYRADENGNLIIESTIVFVPPPSLVYVNFNLLTK